MSWERYPTTCCTFINTCLVSLAKQCLCLWGELLGWLWQSKPGIYQQLFISPRDSSFISCSGAVLWSLLADGVCLFVGKLQLNSNFTTLNCYFVAVVDLSFLWHLDWHNKVEYIIIYVHPAPVQLIQRTHIVGNNNIRDQSDAICDCFASTVSCGSFYHICITKCSLVYILPIHGISQKSVFVIVCSHCNGIPTKDSSYNMITILSLYSTYYFI